MELKAGYRQTEEGVIPEDWEVAAIVDLNPFVTSGSRGWAAFYSNRGSPFIRITNLSRESIGLDLSDLKLVKLPTVTAEGIRTQLQIHDILISITADIGIIGYVSAEVPRPAYINQHIALVRFDQDRTNGRFVGYFLASEGPQKLFRAFTDIGAKTGMNLLTVQKIRLALPPLPEQHAIAAALSDVDALISALDKLIAKKRDIKQAAMQQLLTGKKRLPGFSGEWEVLDFHQVFRKLGAKDSQIQTHEYADHGSYPVVDQGKSLAVAYSDKSEKVVRCPPEGIIVFGDHTRIVKFIDFDFLVGADGTQLLTTNGDYSAKFFYYQLSVKEIPSTGYNRHFKFLRGMSFLSPLLPEQQAVATVLSDMDAEIAALEQRRDKTRALKQGMMQELLTGRIRLT